jgi:hypothetical protein
MSARGSAIDKVVYSDTRCLKLQVAIVMCSCSVRNQSMAPSTLALSSCTARPLTAGWLGQGLRNCESTDAEDETNGRSECKRQREADLGRRWRVGRQELQFRVLCKRHERMEFRIRVKDVMHCVTRALPNITNMKKSIGKSGARELVH